MFVYFVYLIWLYLIWDVQKQAANFNVNYTPQSALFILFADRLGIFLFVILTVTSTSASPTSTPTPTWQLAKFPLIFRIWKAIFIWTQGTGAFTETIFNVEAKSILIKLTRTVHGNQHEHCNSSIRVKYQLLCSGKMKVFCKPCGQTISQPFWTTFNLLRNYLVFLCLKTWEYLFR